MNQFLQMLQRARRSPHYSKMVRSVEPLHDHFGINHFWYYRLTPAGQFCYVGLHEKWEECCFDRHFSDFFSLLRHPDLMEGGIHLMQNASGAPYRKVLDEARDQFNIHFGLELLKKSAAGIDVYGFATSYDHLRAAEILLNDLGVLSYFLKSFREDNKKLFSILYENQLDLEPHLGDQLHQKPQMFIYPRNREGFLKKIGLQEALSLSRRERDVLTYFAWGYPASYIAMQLELATRTVENYIAALKEKLYCDSKIKLIQKARALTGFTYDESK